MPSLIGQAQMPFMPVPPLSGLGNDMNWSEQAFNACIDSRIRHMTQQNNSTGTVSLDPKESLLMPILVDKLVTDVLIGLKERRGQ
jgi:hypothetical protein